MDIIIGIGLWIAVVVLMSIAGYLVKIEGALLNQGLVAHEDEKAKLEVLKDIETRLTRGTIQ